MPRDYQQPLDPEPVEGQEVIRVAFRLDGNKPTVVARIGEGFIKTVDGAEQTNNIGLPLWKAKGSDVSKEMELDAMGDILRANWSILEDTSLNKKKRIYNFMLTVGWAIYDAVGTAIPSPLKK